MEEQKPQGHPEGCRCFQCRCGTDCKCGHGWHGHRHFLLRFLVGIIILVIVFAVGVKLGELKSSFGHGHYSGGRHYMMQPYGTMPQFYYYGGYGQAYPPMMQRGVGTSTSPVAPK